MTQKKLFLRALAGEKTGRIPFWLMRQAGRYLPEYRQLREKAGGFLALAFDPGLATEVTLQPLRRYGMDAAILFSDILVVPLALGQNVTFEAGEGPVLRPAMTADAIASLSLERFDEILAPIYRTVTGVRSGMAREGFNDTALIGFAGAPWTVACYMVEGGTSRDFATIRQLAYRQPDSFAALIDLLVESTSRYLIGQIEAGAEAVQLFESWAGIPDAAEFERWVITPTRRIVQNVKKTHPDVPVIGFPRGAGYLYNAYASGTGISAIGVDQHVPLTQIAKELQPLLPVQGNLDPFRLVAGGKALEDQTQEILNTLGQAPFIFNLGHGIHKETPPENVEKLAGIIRSWRT